MTVRDDDFRRLGSAFAVGGEAYERLRPGYPDAAIDWLLDGLAAGASVVDVGAGTGKLSDALARRGCRVVAVDPSPDMLAQLSARQASVAVHQGTGEATGLPDDGADLVTYAQSWHWIDPVAGLHELKRLLGPGGRGGWIWNFMDVRVDWVAELATIWHSVEGAEAVSASRQAPDLDQDFAPLETSTTEWQQPMATTDLADLVTTRSYYLNAPPTERPQIRDRVARFLTDRFRGHATVSLPYLTHAFRARLRPMLQR